jgi:ABC-type phosphate transport system permease subunit
MIPLIEGFRATTIIKAIVLASLVTAISSVVAIETRRQFDDTKSSLYIAVNDWFPGKNLGYIAIILVVFASSFLTSFVIYNVLHIVFGYGSAMIADGKYLKSLPPYY